MRQFKFGSVVLLTMILVGCGGGGSDIPAKPKFTSQVSFGDSLSDVGSYRVSAIGSTVANVGEFTINAASGVATNWTELTAPKFGLAAPCAAVVGGFGVPRAPALTTPSTTGCYGYAQGGSRVTNPSGVGFGTGPMTEPVVTQIVNYLRDVGGSFKGNEIVFVMAGANDVFVQAASVVDVPTQVSAVAAVQTAASQLATAVKTQIIANGAKYVAVINVPDIASTPQVTSLTGSALTQTTAVMNILVSAFNAQLKADLPDSANVLNVDAFTASHDEVANPGKYNLTNVTLTACSLPLTTSSSLTCNASNLSGTLAVVDHYLFADKVHPTPYGHSLFALYVLQAMTNKGWY
jgi:outer membrane lipase/esterase